MIHIALLLALLPQNDTTQANSYDDSWESAWVTHCRTIYSTTNKAGGFVLQIGDSITHSAPYAQWPRAGTGASNDDTSVLSWIGAATWSGTVNDTSSKNGFYLAVADTEANADGLRGMCAASGLRADEFINGNNNGTVAMPSETNTAAAKTIVAAGDTTYGGNLNATTVAAAFADAQFAVLMLGTNDASAGRSVQDFMADLTAIVDVLEGRDIVVILSTIPPHYAATALAESYNDSIRAFAQSRGLPLIDFEAEVLARRPTDWNGTLMNSNDVHPSASGGGYTSSSNPYSPGGDVATDTTGDACTYVGYLLRSWLTVQKLKEVRLYVVDGVDPPATPGPTPTPTPVPSTPHVGDSANGDDSLNDTLCGGSVGAGAPGAAGLAWLAAALLIAAGARRR